MQITFKKVAILLIVLIQTCHGLCLGDENGPNPAEYLKTRNGRFIRSNRPFIVRANCRDNMFAATLIWDTNQALLDESIRTCKEYGFNTIRIWASGTGGENEKIFNLWKSNPNDFFAKADGLVKRCREEGLFLVLALSTHGFPKGAGSGSKYDITGETYQAYKGFVQSVCAHYRNEPSILFWELSNEDFAGGWGSPRIDEMLPFYQQAAKDIKGADPNHLLSTGLDHMCSDSGNNFSGWIQTSSAWEAIHKISDIDICSVHIYQDWTYHPWKSREECLMAIKIWADISRRLGKPLFVGELGAEFGAPGNTQKNGFPENPALKWLVESIQKERVAGYGFHGFYAPGCLSDKYALIPTQNPLTVEMIRAWNATAY